MHLLSISYHLLYSFALQVIEFLLFKPLLGLLYIISFYFIIFRVARNELVLRFLSLVCLSLMLGLFVIQLEIAWRSREVIWLFCFANLGITL